MNTEYLGVAIILIAFGLIVVAFGIWTRLGKNRAWYLVPNYYVLLPKSGHYALPVAGLMLILLGISLLFPHSEFGDNIMWWGAFPLMVIVFLIVVFEPKWFKPQWIQWLEENHRDILELLIEEARKTSNWKDWAERVSTQEGLEEWVSEVREKYR